MQLHEIQAPKGVNKRKKILGRGRGSGHGKTSGRGHTGQKSRSGRGIIKSLEGGQMTLIRRLPKVGFRSKRPVLHQVVTLTDLARFNSGETVDAQSLKDKGIIKNVFKSYKVLANGEIKQSLTVKAYAFSKKAQEQIEQAGGKVEIIDAKIVKEEKSKQ